MEADQRGTTNWLYNPRKQGSCTTTLFDSGHSIQQGCNSMRTVFWQVIRWHNVADIARENFPSMFERSANPRAKRFLQDGFPIQNSVAAKRVYDEIGAFVFCLPPHSPDLNPTENVFHLVNMETRKDTIKRIITEKTFTSFSQRERSLNKEYQKERSTV